MPLPSSGPISASAINTELGRASTSPISLALAAGGSYAAINTNSASRPDASAPHGMGEWHGYDHSATPPASGDCYEVYAASPTTVYWTDANGVARSDSIAAAETRYLCSQITPYESPAADLIVTPCGAACSEIHTTLAGADSDPCSC